MYNRAKTSGYHCPGPYQGTSVRPFDRRGSHVDRVAKHKRIAQVILFLLTMPFAFFGVDYDFRGGGQQDAVATVGGETITQNDYAEAMREQTEQLRRQLGPQLRPAHVRQSRSALCAADSLDDQRLLTSKARAPREFRVSDEQLQQFIAGHPGVPEDGKFGNDRYRRWLGTQSMTTPPTSSSACAATS